MKTLQTKKTIAVDPEVMVVERKQGLMLIASMRPLINNLIVKTPEDYLLADEHLAKINAGRATWKNRMAEILDPLDESVKAARKALKSAENLYNEVDQPLLDMTAEIKKQMREYKLEEIKQIQAAEEESQKERAEIQRRIREKEAAEAKAKTAGVASRIIDAKARLQQALADKQMEDSPAPVKANSSQARRIKGVRVTNKLQLILHLVDFPGDLFHLVEINMGELNAYFKLKGCPLGEFLPGAEGYEDVIIAGKR